MNRFEILHELSLEQLANCLALYEPCNICEYRSTTNCESITHKKESCAKGIMEWLRKEL